MFWDRGKHSMKHRILSFLLLLLGPAIAFGQFTNFGQAPVEISSDGETRFEGGVAIADKNVVIHYGDVSIYCDHAEYNPDTHDLLLKGNVRFFRGNFAFICDRAVYNLETKELKAANFGGAKQPYQIAGEDVFSPGDINVYVLHNGIFTTSDSSMPDYAIHAHTVRVYPNDRIIFYNATVYVGRMPILWLPYLYQSLSNQFSLNFEPGYKDEYGAYLLTTAMFQLAEGVTATTHWDIRTLRGPSSGVDLNYRFGPNDESHGLFRTYFLNDQDPNINETSLGRQVISSGRYRLSYQSQTYITSDMVLTTDLNKFSDPYILQDFFPGEFSTDPVPDNFLQLAQKGEAYTLTATLRYQLDTFFESTERLPDVSWEVARTPFLNSPIFYEATTNVGFLRRAFIQGFNQPPEPDYQTFRIDSFHQFLYPKTYFGWLSLIPRVGVRTTYYERSGTFIEAGTEPGQEGGIVVNRGARTRFIWNAGAEASFKLSRAYEGVQVRWLGLDGLRHIIQPYTNFSWVSNPNVKPVDILPFDRFIPNTQIPPIDFPQFVSADSIDHWTLWRLGVRNRLQTRRDNGTLNWFDLDTYVDVNFKNPYDPAHYSNVVNKLQLNPVPWFGVGCDAQLPVFDPRHNFWDVNTYLNWTINPSIDVQIGDRYLDHNPNEANSNAITFRGYLRLNENWGFSVYEQYEAALGQLQVQQYFIHRDLSSWVAGLGVTANNNGSGKVSIGVAFTLTLKDLPQFGFQQRAAPHF